MESIKQYIDVIYIPNEGVTQEKIESILQEKLKQNVTRKEGPFEEFERNPDGTQNYKKMIRLHNVYRSLRVDLPEGLSNSGVPKINEYASKVKKTLIETGMVSEKNIYKSEWWIDPYNPD